MFWPFVSPPTGAPVSWADWDAFVYAHPAGWWWQTSGWQQYLAACEWNTQATAISNGRGEIARLSGISQEGETWILMAGDRIKFDPPRRWETRIIDLRQDETLLWQGLRKSNKAMIHKVERRTRCGEWTARDVTPLFLLHTQVAGRQTRSEESWRLMEQWIGTTLRITCAYAGAASEGEPSALGATAMGSTPGASTLLGFAAVYEYKRHAYLGHMASTELNMNAALVWTAMKAAKARGCVSFETGWQGYEASQKGRGIEFWRTGFGGENVPVDEGYRWR